MTKKAKKNIKNNTASSFSVTLKEGRKFPPSKSFSEFANISPSQDKALRKKGLRDPEAYWADVAKELTWFKSWKKVLRWKAPRAEWFVGGKLNASYNCLDRHLEENRHKVALIWEGEPGEVTSWTYSQLHREVELFTASLKRLGLSTGDRVAIYMPMIPEAVVAMLACARGGFVHTVVFGGFSAEALRDRVNDAEASVVITADGGYRKGSIVPLKQNVDTAVGQCPGVKNVVVVKRAQAGQLTRHVRSSVEPVIQKGAQQWDYHALLASVSSFERVRAGQPVPVDSEHPLFILYTSGTTGKPKGLVHTTGGYMAGALSSMRTVFDLKDSDLYWCTADIGWITGHSYVVYGPLAAGASVLIYEGAPMQPAPDRFWEIIERHRVSILYTAPTAIRSFMRLGDEHPKSRDLSSLRLLGSVGEPINPEAWMWYRSLIGGDRCPIVDTYWQTETGSIVISPMPGATPTKPGSATLPLPGYAVDVVDKAGKPVPLGSGGYLIIRKPWPSMARTIYKDPERFEKAYFSEYPGGIYFTGDGARKDKDGYIWVLGRVDDVLNVSGHRIGTMEVESALVSHPKVAEAAVVGRPDEIKGQALVVFVTLKHAASKAIANDSHKMEEIRAELRAHVTKEIGALARPDDIRFTDALPKTRSGKIMRRLLRELATSGTVKGDTTTLEDLSVIAALQADED
ncbi:MAG: acetate--CoA ligase [Oligoflexia bacterium]|nr:acetate--CoA ligase [Oligoflexia bacterium]